MNKHNMQSDNKVNKELNSFGNERFIIAEDQKTATYISPEGRTFKLIVGSKNVTCFNCFLYTKGCSNLIKHYCTCNDRLDNVSINWKLQKDK